jgi:transcriptional regulator with XRE-family HTH domain
MDQTAEKTEKGLQPSVAIDGAKIKTVREQKKLTQLYVASVVGVTTDTISRWENNRYPSIKRDNAEKLAAALEVDLAEILQAVSNEEAAEPAAAAASGRRRMLVTAVVTLLCLAVAALLLFRYLAPAPTAVRWAPRFAAPGEIVPVQIKVSVRNVASKGFIIKEKLPAGWLLVSSRPVAAPVKSPGEEIKWFIPGGKDEFTISYTAQVPATAAMNSDSTLLGSVVFHGGGMSRSGVVAGAGKIRIGAYHWADANGDGRIDDNEIMPAYYICEEIKGPGLDWKTIEAIWSGKGYRWVPATGFEVVR